MKEQPLAVAVSALIKDGKILLNKRIRGDYVGLWSLPGGKVDNDEHASEAAVREIFEESGIVAEFKSYLGLVSEHLIEDGSITRHFLLHLCELESKDALVKNESAGKLEWFDLSDIARIKGATIPSDFLMIEKMIKNKEKNYFDCVIYKKGDEHMLKKFD